jgi:cytochrome c5
MTSRRNIIAALLGVAAVITVAALLRAEPTEDAPRPAPLHSAATPAATADSSVAGSAQFQQAANLGKYQGIENCVRCHTKPQQGEKSVPDHVKLTEAVTWSGDDKHHLAYDHLRDGLGQRIGQRLNANVFDPATGCIQCHAAPDATARAKADPLHQPILGVDCEACHGPGKNWVGEHQKHDTWYARSRDEKTNLGFIDIRSPVSRAELCLSCHSGSPADGRVITHAMYAAGHPPLTGFEIETFSEMMPRHWRYPYQKPGATSASFERTRNMLVSSVVALRMAMELTVADAAADNQLERWPEFARLDCFVCHHDVDQADWRRHQSGAFALGRPRLITGCLPLVAVAARAVQGPAADVKLNALIERLQTPFETSAFGDPAEIVQRGTSIIASCRNLERQLESAPLSPDAVRDVLHAIAAQTSAEDCDFDTARQLFGAWSIVWQELVDNHVLPTSKNVERGIASGKTLFSLGSAKPAGSAATAPPARSVTDELTDLFGNRAKYEPQKFARAMAKLDALAAEPQINPGQ